MKLDERKGRWVKILDELKDCILFISAPCSFSVLARHFPGYKANCIYINKIHFTYCKEIRTACHHPGSGVVVYDIENGDVAELCHQYGCSPIFWPPPCWLYKKKTDFKLSGLQHQDPIEQILFK
ncbi:hypothetical protein Tsubulata_024069 [Turnera subulata]|uniref:KIB1-4 beta-propeller domain-containing protein n=1 Tax=Turnera subulata TaxID=218843 RepID=A0A9Q0FM68_9ROSI|nr:hypothetical protein Tsubulata_024069 [Turnera subulata]